MNTANLQCGPRTQTLIRIPFVIAALVVNAASADEIVLRPQAVPQSTVVRLGDVAEIRGTDSGRAARLAALPLMPAPAPSTRRYLRAQEVQDLLFAHGEDPAQLNIGGSAQVAVLPFAAEAATAGSANHAPPVNSIDPAWLDGPASRHVALEFGRATEAPSDNSRTAPFNEHIRQLIVDHLITQTGRADGWNVSCNLSPRQSAQLAMSSAPPTCDGGNPPWTGRQRFTISLATASGPTKLPIVASVTRLQPVVVAVRPISRGAIITAADLAVKRMDDAPAANGRRAPVDAVDDLIGMEASRTIQVGDIVFTDQAQPPLLVKRGETITVVAQGGGIRVRTIALARQDGAHGDLVQLESLESKERFDARVTGLREASVLAPARSQVDPATLDAVAQAARDAQLEHDVNTFRRYLPGADMSQDDMERQLAAFRRFLENDGRSHVQTR